MTKAKEPPFYYLVDCAKHPNETVLQIWSSLNGHHEVMVTFSGGICKLIRDTSDTSKLKHGVSGEQCFLAGVMLGIIHSAMKEMPNAQQPAEQPVEASGQDRGDDGEREPSPGDPRAEGSPEGTAGSEPTSDKPPA